MSRDAAFLSEARAGRHDLDLQDPDLKDPGLKDFGLHDFGLKAATATAKAVNDELSAPRDVIERARSIVAGHF